MGNTSVRASQHSEFDPQTSSQLSGLPGSRKGTYSSFLLQFSLSNLLGGSSGRSLLSVTSNHSVCSAQRPWSRISRRRWHNSTLNNPLDASKTAWPVPRVEALFLPDFPVATELLQRDFSVEHTVAKGAFGEVYKVRRASDNKEYALKVLSKARVVSENAVRQVKEEAKIQEACGHHTFIVGAVSRWQTKKRLYIVSEYVAGGELLALLDKYRRLPEDLVRIYLAELALALEFLHGAGVVYRDLKPENVLLDTAGHLQLVDFGLSKWLSQGARTTTLCGTLKYMAPEVVGREPYGHAVDWWSLGVLTCRMLTDQYPAPALGADRDAAGGAPPPGALPPAAGSLSAAARALLPRLLDPEPRRRLRTVRELQHTAFYMGYSIDHVRALKTSPRAVLEQHGPPSPAADPAPAGADYSDDLRAASQLVFADFERVTIV